MDESICQICKDRKAELILYDYYLCKLCKDSIGLYSEKTIRKHVGNRNQKLSGLTYEEEARNKLYFLEKNFIKKRIKLMDIIKKIGNLKKDAQSLKH